MAKHKIKPHNHMLDAALHDGPLPVQGTAAALTFRLERRLALPGFDEHRAQGVGLLRKEVAGLGGVGGEVVVHPDEAG